jgi:tripartite-type tricarboxylate transporter receptor subunit TctC
MRGLVAALIFCVGAGAALAQNYPTRPIRIILPVSPGGGIDIIMRLIAPKIGKSLGQTIVVDNRPGASGAIALELTSRATPDGYNLMVFSASQVIYSALNKTKFDLFKDFIPISQISAAPYVLVVYPPLPARSVKDLVAYAKTNPGKLNYASAGNGSLQQLSTEFFATIEGIKLTHIPYKGVGSAIPDLASGRTQMTMSSVTSMVPHIRAGRLRPLAVTSAQRTPVLPDVATMVEAGVPGFVVTQWLGSMAPAGTPRPIVQLLQREIAKALKQPDVAAALARDGTDTVGSSPTAFAAHMRAEYAKWLKVAQKAGIPIRK